MEYVPIDNVNAITKVETIYSLRSQITRTDTLGMLKASRIDGSKQIVASQKVSRLIKTILSTFQQTCSSIVHIILYLSLSFTGLIFINAN